jgi:CRISPR-associated protein Cas1
MTNRIIDIANENVFLKIKNGLLVIIEEKEEKAKIPLAEINSLLISNRACLLTHAVLSRITESGGMIVFCNEKMMPAGAIIPYYGNSECVRILRLQTNVKLPVKKRIWQQVVKAKVKFQAELLIKLQGNDAGLFPLIIHVQSGDPSNIEAQAAKKYWHALFGENFRRNKDGDGLNILLNYGYAVLRACLARAFCSSGFNPQLGIHHSNQYNAFVLVDDFIETFRPLVDYSVYMINGKDNGCELNSESKRALVSSLFGCHIALNYERLTLQTIFARLSGSFIAILEKKSDKIMLPHSLFKFIE